VPQTALTKAWRMLGHWLGVINTQLLLAIAFFVVITPLALLFKVMGRDLLGMKPQHRKSDWVVVDKSWTADSFKNQY